jgi:pyruvate/2-oxoglutarate dehydrogenase complex dihydrolipoamide dehydrogenase (E3) component
VVSATDLLNGKTSVGDKVLVIGGDLVGVETADYLGAQNKHVSIMEMLPEIALSEHPSTKYFLFERFKSYGIDIFCDS